MKCFVFLWCFAFSLLSSFFYKKECLDRHALILMATTQVILPWSVNFWPCYRAFPCCAAWPLALKGTVGGRSGTDSGSSRASSVRDSSKCGSGWNVSHNLEYEKHKYVFIDGCDLSTVGGIILSKTQSAFSESLKPGIFICFCSLNMRDVRSNARTTYLCMQTVSLRYELPCVSWAGGWM